MKRRNFQSCLVISNKYSLHHHGTIKKKEGRGEGDDKDLMGEQDCGSFS